MTFLKQIADSVRSFAERVGVIRATTPASPMTKREFDAAVRFLMSLPDIADNFSAADVELALEDEGFFKSGKVNSTTRVTDPLTQWVVAHTPTYVTEAKNVVFKEAWTQADVELAIDDRGWITGARRMAGELDPVSRTVQVNKCRYYWLRDPLAKQAVRLWTDYGMGDSAVTYSTEDKAVKTKLDKWMKDYRNRSILSAHGMRRLSTKLLIDGELFFAFYEDGVVRTFDCLQITDIITDEDDQETVLCYKRVTQGSRTENGSMSPSKIFYYAPWSATDAERTKAEEMKDPATGSAIKLEAKCKIYHLPFDPFEKRGNGILGSCVNWTREHRRFLEARVAITQALAKFAWKTTVKGGQKVINQLQKGFQSSYTSTGTSDGAERNPVNAPGANWVQNSGVDMTPMPRTTGAGEAKVDADNFKLQVCAGTGIMLHYLGDPSTGNLAVATAMELPMLKMFGGYQKLWKDAFRDFFSIVLDEKPEDEPAEILVDLPSILEDDLRELGTFLTSFAAVFPEAKVEPVLKACLVAMNIQDVDSVMEVIEQQKILNEQKAKQDAVAERQHGLAIAKVSAPAPGTPVISAHAQPTAVPPAKTEAESVESLTAALNNLAEAARI